MKNKLLSKVLENTRIAEKEKIHQETQLLISEIKKIIKNMRISAEVFIGGSLIKNTLIRKKKQDIDFFLRFGRKYSEEKIQKLFSEIVKKIKFRGRKNKIHGSRDYFRLESKNIAFEIVPVLKISSPNEARNSTDLSYFHVNYVVKKLGKNPKLTDEIVLAKTFAYSSGCYGAESYIRGFSGYALELLIIHYGSFLNFIGNIIKSKDKIILDPEKFYKNKQEILTQLNEAKLESPVILIDPTHKERNVTAALSNETFEKFKEFCKNFSRAPSEKFFTKKEISEAEIKKTAKNKEFLKIKAKTNRQEGSVAGSKLLKFFNFLSHKLEKHNKILRKEFVYGEGREAVFYFILKKRKTLLIQGPPIASLENSLNFRKKHKNSFVKKGKVYAKEKAKPAKAILQEIKKQKKLLNEMGITSAE